MSPFTLRTGETSRGAIDWVELRPSKIVHGYPARALMYPEVPFSKINISLLRNFGRFFETKPFFFSKKHFLAERKNSFFSVIPARTGSVVILGHFLMAQRCSPSFIENGSKLRVLIIAKPKRPKKGVSPEK